MKLKMYYIWEGEIQEYLDKYEEKIKFLFRSNYSLNERPFIIIIDEA